MEIGEYNLPPTHFHLTAILAVTILQAGNIRGFPSVTSCHSYSLGEVQYKCRHKLVDGAKSGLCEPACNTTAIQRSSPDSCYLFCCQLCNKECDTCFYMKQIQVHFIETQWTLDFNNKQLDGFRVLERKVQRATTTVVKALQISGFILELLSVKQLPQDNTIEVLLQLSSRTQGDVDRAIFALQSASKNGTIGDIQVDRFSFMELQEEGKEHSKNKQQNEIDFVELGLTCAVSGIIIVALGILLFYCCTTASQRQRYRNCCRTQVAQQNPTIAGT